MGTKKMAIHSQNLDQFEQTDKIDVREFRGSRVVALLAARFLRLEPRFELEGQRRSSTTVVRSGLRRTELMTIRTVFSRA